MFSKVNNMRKDLDKLNKNIKTLQNVFKCGNEIKNNLNDINELKEEFEKMPSGPIDKNEIINELKTLEYLFIYKKGLNFKNMIYL